MPFSMHEMTCKQCEKLAQPSNSCAQRIVTENAHLRCKEVAWSCSEQCGLLEPAC